MNAYHSLDEATIRDLQAAMASRMLSCVEIVRGYLARIEALDRAGPTLRSVLEVNPKAQEIAAERDAERRAGYVRGPLHGIPVLLKDNIDTADTMMTTAGSLALVGEPPARDATVAARLRAAGAVILGKASLSEWANMRSPHSSSGWCGRGGQCRNPYVLDRNPCGSSSGSAVAVSANLCAAALGTETDGSIVCPAGANGVVGIKPTVGLTSRAGVVPISHSQDTVGPFGRTVADAATMLGALVGVDPADAATAGSAGRFSDDYTRFLDAAALRGARLGVARNLGFGCSPKVDALMEEAICALREAGADIVDPAEVPGDSEAAGAAEREALLYEFKADLNVYLAARQGVALVREGYSRTLAGVIAYNEAHHEEELRYFGQETMLQAESKGPLGDSVYVQALETSRRLSRQEGLDTVMDRYDLVALVAPTAGPAWPIDLVNGDHGGLGSCGPAARAGYPLVSVPAGFVSGLPVGVTFMGRPYSEGKLIRLAYAFEQATRVRRAPQCIATLLP